jgi:hypothetical protein
VVYIGAEFVPNPGIMTTASAVGSRPNKEPATMAQVKTRLDSRKYFLKPFSVFISLIQDSNLTGNEINIGLSKNK